MSVLFVSMKNVAFAEGDPPLAVGGSPPMSDTLMETTPAPTPLAEGEESEHAVLTEEQTVLPPQDELMGEERSEALRPQDVVSSLPEPSLAEQMDERLADEQVALCLPSPEPSAHADALRPQDAVAGLPEPSLAEQMDERSADEQPTPCPHAHLPALCPALIHAPRTSPTTQRLLVAR